MESSGRFPSPTWGKAEPSCLRGVRQEFDPWWRRFPGGGHGNLLQHSCLENPMDRGAWRATVHGVTKSRTRPKRLSMHGRSSATFLFNRRGNCGPERERGLPRVRVCQMQSRTEISVMTPCVDAVCLGCLHGCTSSLPLRSLQLLRSAVARSGANLASTSSIPAPRPLYPGTGWSRHREAGVGGGASASGATKILEEGEVSPVENSSWCPVSSRQLIS